MAEVSLPGTTALSLDGPSGAYRIFLSVPAVPPPPGGFPLLVLLDANLCFGTVSDLLRQGGFRPGVSRLCPAIVAGIAYPTDQPLDRARRSLDYTPGPSVEGPGRGAPSGPPPNGGRDAFLAFLRAEADAGRAVLDGAFVRLPGHEVRLTPEDEALWDRIAPGLAGETRFRPPRVRDFATEFGIDEKDVRRVLRLTQKLGRTDQIAHDHFFAREVTREMVAIILDVAAQSPDGWFTAPAFRDRVQNGRKVAIEILDFFDRLGLTLRRGDLRRINPHRADLFGDIGRESSPVGRPDFKSGWGSRPVPGGFDSHSLPPSSQGRP